MKKFTPKQLLKLKAVKPELADFILRLQESEKSENLKALTLRQDEEFNKNISTIKGKDGVSIKDVDLTDYNLVVTLDDGTTKNLGNVRGPAGKDGKAPTLQEIMALIPIPADGKDGKTPTKTELTKLIKPLIPAPLKGDPGIDGINGKDGSPDTGTEIINKINTVPKTGPKIKAEHIEDFEREGKRLFEKEYIHRGGGVSHDSTLTGTGSSSNPLSVSLTLDGLTDVIAASPSTGQVLTWNGANWINDNATGGSGGGATLFKDQTPTDGGTYALLQGMIDGANTVFTVAEGQYITGTLTVWLNGQQLAQGTDPEDWTETDPVTGTFTFNTAPQSSTNDTVYCEYSTTAGGGGGNAAGADTQVQFNDSGALNGDPNFTFNKTTNALTVDDILVTDEVYGVGWNGSLEVPTKNALYDKIETMGGGGATAFTGLSDTFASYTGNGSNFVMVNAAETALEPVTLRSREIWVGNASDKPAAVNMSGDINISDNGTTTIQAASVDIAMLSATGTPSASNFLRGDNTWATPAGSGTVTATGGSLTANSVVLGAGTTDTKVVAGITTDGTSQLNLGVNATTLGKLKLFGNTSGDVTLQPNAVAGTGIVLTLPATTGTVALTSQLTSGTVTSVGFTGGLISVATATTTPALTVAGTSGGIPYFSSASTWASSAALAANAIVVGGGAGATPATVTTGANVLTALGIAVGSAGAFVTFNGALGTPSSGTVTNLTGTASININGTVGATTPTTGVFTTLVAGSTTSLLLGTAGSAVGNIGFRNATSGTITLAPTTGALGTVTITLPATAGTVALLGGDVWTGVHDFGGATSLEIPNGAGGTTLNDAGEVCVDTTSDTLNFYDGTLEAVLTPIMSKAITIESPTAAEDISLFYSDEAITITKIVFVITGATSVTTTIRQGTDRSATGTEVVTGGTVANSTTTGNVVTSFNDATVPADSFLWLETTALSGTPTSLNVTIFYRQDA